MSVSFSELADLSLRGAPLTREQCQGIILCDDEALMALLQQAYRVRREYFGNHVHVQVLRNAKSGLCSEDCHYCSQSSVSRALIEKYPLVSRETLLTEARKAKQMKATRFCISTSGGRPSEREVEQLCGVISAIKGDTGLPLCATLGLITEGQARRLKAAGLDRVNHNLNTSRRYYGQICTTHTFQDRLDTVARCQAAGLEICCGGIVGQGETEDDIVDMLLAIREIRPQSVPINFLIPIAGTPFERMDTGLNPRKCLKILCLARLVNPQSELRAAGGWEYHLRTLKPMALYTVDSVFVTGYLTTGGTSVREMRGMIDDMGFESTIEDTGG
ncbi:MAG: biotin synthase BioB [Dehalococcoidales bacterium]|nr:biotin synthase BioB [Dehalococcoidales bacterium]